MVNLRKAALVALVSGIGFIGYEPIDGLAGKDYAEEQTETKQHKTISEESQYLIGKELWQYMTHREVGKITPKDKEMLSLLETALVVYHLDNGFDPLSFPEYNNISYLILGEDQEKYELNNSRVFFIPHSHNNEEFIDKKPPWFTVLVLKNDGCYVQKTCPLGSYFTDEGKKLEVKANE